MNEYLVFAASIAFIFTAINQVLSLPAGLRNILKEELSTPVLFSVHLFGFLMYAGWSIYGILLKDPAIIFGCGLGVLSSAVLLIYTCWLRLAKR